MAFLSQTSFNSGLLDPTLNARALDVEKTKRSCKALENLVLHTHGFVRRRQGTVFCAAAKYDDRPCRVVKFNFASDETYVLEVGDQYIRFYKNFSQIDDGKGAPLEVMTPYKFADLASLDLKQINDVVVISHPKYHPAILSRLSASPESWQWKEVDFALPGTYPPLRDPNLDTENKFSITAGPPPGSAPPAWVDNTAYAVNERSEVDGRWFICKEAHTSSESYDKPLYGIRWATRWTEQGTGGGTTNPGDSIKINSVKPTFDPGHVESYWYIGHARTATEAQLVWEQLGSGKVDQVSSAILVDGPWSLATYGGPANVFEGTLVLQRSFDGGTTYEDYRTYYNSNTVSDDSKVNYADAGEELTAVYMRFKLLGPTGLGATPNNSANLTAQTTEVGGIVKVTQYIKEDEVNAVIVTPLFSNADTDRWAEGAWSPYRGFPTASTLHELRLVYGGTPTDPTTLYGSATDDFYNFRLGVADADAWVYTIGAGEQNEIRSLVSSKSLLILTTGGEWVATGTGQEPITPTNIRIRRHSNLGSADLQGILVDNAVLFVQRGRRRVREYYYNWSEENYQAVDLTMLSETLTSQGVTTWDHQRNRDSVIWSTNGSGELLGMTYERNEQVYGWHKHTTQGRFESVAVVYGQTEEDDVWFSTERFISGGTKRYIEYFRPDGWAAFDNADRESFHHVDCATVYDGEPTETITGLGHLEGREVEVWADGHAQKNKVVASGSITLDDPASKVTVGLGFVSQLETFPLELGLQDGASIGRFKHLPRANFKFLKSLLAEVSTSVDWDKAWELVDFRRLGPEGDGPDDGTSLFDGDKEVHVPGRHDKELTIAIRSIGPSPFALLGLSMEAEFTES